MPPKRTKKVRLGVYRTVPRFNPKTGDIFSSYGNKICQASYRVPHEENNSQQTAQKGMNEN